MDWGKLKGIWDWPTPTSVKEVRGLLGFRNFYWQFIKHYSDVTKPLNDTTKDWTFLWTHECQKAFDELKRQFTKEPVLLMPDQTKPFQIECDTSKYASGAVLMQIDTKGDQHPCAFISNFFSEMERNFKIYDRELLAIIQALEEWQHYIQGSPCTTIIHSDHKTLTYYQEAQKLNWWQAWWYLYLSEFDVKMIHTPGPKMIQLDTLFHWPDFIPEKNTDNEDIIMLPENLFINLINLDLQWRIANTKDLDTDAMETLTMLLEQGSAMLRWELGDWTVKKSEGQNILFFKGKNYIHENDKLWWDITRMFHDHETAGHPRELKTYNTIWHHYWWLGLQTFVKNYMQGCRICQQFKTHWSPAKPTFISTETALYSNHRITTSRRVWLDTGCCRPRTYQRDNSYPMHQDYYSRRNSETFAREPIQKIQTSW